MILLTAKFDSGEKTGIPAIAAGISVSPQTVGKLLQTLAKSNIISSTKGTACGLGFSACSARHPCPIHHQSAPVRDGFEKICKAIIVLDLPGPVNKGEAYLVGLKTPKDFHGISLT